jgi:hypothetical protein
MVQSCPFFAVFFLPKIQVESNAESIRLKQQAMDLSLVMRHQSGLPQMGQGDWADTSLQPFDVDAAAGAVLSLSRWGAQWRFAFGDFLMIGRPGSCWRRLDLLEYILVAEFLIIVLTRPPPPAGVVVLC